MSERRWEGASALEPLLVPVNELVPHPENPRRGNPELIADSLRRFGQVRPVTVRKETREVVAGNHTLRAAREVLGWTHIAAVLVDMDEREARAYLIADNRLSDLSSNEDEQLAAILGKLAEEGRLEGTGYSADDYDDVMVRLHEQAEGGPAGPEGGGFMGSGGREDESRSATHEVVLLLDEHHYTSFGRFVSMLRKEYGCDSVTEAVYRAVKDAAGNL